MLSDELFSQLADYQYSVPKGGDKVYKDECIYCFETPISDDGLYVCLSTLLATCRCHLSLHMDKTQKHIFLNIRKVPVQIHADEEEDEGPPDKKPTKMAIGMEGGFDVQTDKVEYEQQNCLAIANTSGTEIKTRIHLPNQKIPLNLQLSIAAVLSHQGVHLAEDVQAWQEKREISKHASALKQLDNGVKIPPSGWKCTLCDLTQNLWLNLTDGTILCGRKYFDGSGGNNHALEYFHQTQYPLAVKLGTIGPDGGDVYSYDEDDMVEDPFLVQHLAHFGINVAALEKTDKTMTELEIDANLSLKAEWDLIQESGKKLVPCYGPGYTGMINLGNSCYMNSVMQVLFSIPECISSYPQSAVQIFTAVDKDVPSDFVAQMTKLGCGLLSGKYSKRPESEDDDPISQGIRPHMFKSLVGRGHPEFSTNHQQDAHEYFLHILSSIEKTNANIKQQFTFQFTDRYQCSSSHKVSYMKREELCWSLPVPLEGATNKAKFEEFEKARKLAEEVGRKIDSNDVVRLQVPMMQCIEVFSKSENIPDYYSSAIKGKTTANKSTRFATFPDYLAVQMRKFTIGEDWTPKKLDVSIPIVHRLDLNSLRSSGLQPGEEQLPAEDTNPSQAPLQANTEHVTQLMDMGFSPNVARKSCILTHNQGIEAAMGWIFEHSVDPDFEAPLAGESASTIPNPESVMMITSMGFTDEQAKKALQKADNNVEAAVEWIFAHVDELDAINIDEPSNNASDSPQATYKDGDGIYELFAFISHMGTSTSCGHYVCHILKEGRWVIFNDRKVAVSESPPFDLGYLYFYRRISSAS